MQIPVEQHQRCNQVLASLQQDRYPFWSLWRELADFFLPKRYVWLQSDKERRIRQAKNPNILDSTGTAAARTLASGMMNGITSPARPWLRLRIPGIDDQQTSPVRVWLDEVTRRLLLIMAESNFYNALAVMYLDLVVFGTGAMLIYEDFDDVINCYNPALGEYYLGLGSNLRPNTFAREITYNVNQLVELFGESNLSETAKRAWDGGKGSGLRHPIRVAHLIEPNVDRVKGISPRFAYREYYWEIGAPSGTVLSMRGFNELPGIFPRWEVTGNDAYGTSPAMEALGDVIQLQHETKKKAQGLDKLIDPPVIADVQLKHQPTALMPRGITYVAGINSVGVRAAYQIALPLGEISADIMDVRARIRETFHNDLFKMISQLETVRTATEIDARREEKLVLLGPVLERFKQEGLEPAINRIFNIAMRKGLLPEPPPELENMDIEIQYVSILTSAQSAVGVIPTERWLAMIGQVIQVYPQAKNLPNWEAMLRNYGTALGVSARDMNDPRQTAALNAQDEELLAAQSSAMTGEVLVNSARQLSETDVGGGANALQRLIGG